MSDPLGDAAFVRRVLIVLALGGLALLIWTQRQLLLLLFAGILFAIILGAASRGVSRLTRLGPRLSLAIAAVLVVAAGATALWLFGQQMVMQLVDLAGRLPAAWEEFQHWIGTAGLEDQFNARIGQAIPDGSTILAAIQTVLGVLSGAATGAVLALFGGLYIAANPGVYRSGLRLLVPTAHADRIERAFDTTAESLRSWLVGQLISMLVTAVLITLGLMWIGVPSALALGVICGLMGFVPMIGPLLGALPGVLVALSVGESVLLQTIVLYFVVQQLAGSVIEPLLMQRTVNVPPAVTLFSLVAIGGVFGPVGVLLGGPLVVAINVLVRELYVRDALGHEV